VKFNAEGNDTVNIYNRVFKNPDYHVNQRAKMGRISLLNL
jgi:hypothetical protein